MTTRMMVRNGAECLGRSAPSLRSVLRCAPSQRATLASPGAPTPVRLGVGGAGRSMVSIRASSVTTTADAAAATSASAPFKRHERIAAIKVTTPVLPRRAAVDRRRAIGPRPVFAPLLSTFPRDSRAATAPSTRPAPRRSHPPPRP